MGDNFVDRHEELAFLNKLLTRRKPGPGQLILMYGRRRVGKTALLRHWAAQSGVAYTYWVADKEPANNQRRSLVAKMMNVPEEQAPIFDSWPSLWRWLAPRLIADEKRHILILDELPFVVHADSAILSALQNAWDEHWQHSQLVLVLCGSQVKTMETLLQHQSPLFGRFTGQWNLQPLPFSALQLFFPNWSLEEQIALYGIVGGIPAYLNWLDEEQSLTENIRETILSSGSMFMAEPTLLLYDELQDLSTYSIILRAISNGHHTLKEISDACLIGRTNLTFYLQRLQELRFVERRLPATLTIAQQRRSKQGRYHIADPYFRFYFRFLAPHQQALLRPEETLVQIKNELRSFIGLAFEKLAQQWIVQQTRANQLPFTPTAVGSHWDRRVQVDVVAINWESKDILLGECKWGNQKVSRKVIHELLLNKREKVSRALPNNGEGWSFHYAFFARAGFTPAAVTALEAYDGLLIDLAKLAAGLQN